MRTRIQKINGGVGLLIPKEMLDACGIGREATLTIQNKTVVVAPPKRHPRAGWAAALRKIPESHLRRDAEELRDFREAGSEWDQEDWR